MCLLLDFLPQSSLQQHVRSLQEESKQLKVALDKAPTETQMAKLKRRIGKLKGSVYWQRGIYSRVYDTIIGQLETENQSLQGELKQAHRHHHKEIQNYSQLQELVTMLQESHRYEITLNFNMIFHVFLFILDPLWPQMTTC